MPDAATPMMQQYLRIKEQAGDCILFFRLGDFYEMFNEDAITASRELDLMLTTRDRGKEKEDQTPMCGVPYHSAESYIARLIAKGYKVAICEQTEDPALAKGLVDRDIIRFITPGTVVESSMLEEGRSNYVCTVFLDGEAGAVCFADISTGELELADFPDGEAEAHIAAELTRYMPAEAVLNTAAAQSAEISTLLTKRLVCPSQTYDELFEPERAESAFREQFPAESEAYGEGSPAAVCVGALVGYLRDTQRTEKLNIGGLTRYGTGSFMELDYTARRNLELTENLRAREKRGSLLWVLDKTKTAMGGRELRSWVEKPLLSPTMIRRRQAAVGELFDSTVTRGDVIEELKGIGDMERILGRLVFGSGNCRDLRGFAASFEPLPRIVSLLAGARSAALKAISSLDTLEDIRGLIDDAIGDDPPISVREGGMIREGYDPEVDRLRALTNGARDAVAAIESTERERTGFKKLRVGYNKVFGYYIELPRSVSDAVPEDYIRKQTLVNSERFITEELKKLESDLLTARERLTDLEYRIFCGVREQVIAASERIRATAAAVAELDALASLAEVAVRNNYCMPDVDVSDAVDIVDGRHPVVEVMQRDVPFVPNDTHLNCGERRVAIITGPNMAGKSTYMRQTALIVLMAQMGGFVPARSAHIGICDRIFTRIGASDDLAAGQSTFMVEMAEVAAILAEATKSSLIILDEIGRGTSTYDGMAIARAVLEYCAGTLGAKTMFATHYHELTEMEKLIGGVFNLNTAVKKRGEDIVFLRRIVPGGADRSYGVEVAKLAGVPAGVVRRAREVLRVLESGEEQLAASLAPAEELEEQITMEDAASRALRETLKNTDLNTLTPIEAMNLLYALKKSLE